MQKVNLLAPTLNLCNTRITFRQNYYEDALVLSQSLFFPYLDFTKLYHTQERFGGYAYVVSPSISYGSGQTVGLALSAGESRQQSRSRSLTRSTATSIGRTWNSQISASITEAQSWMNSEQHSRSNAVALAHSRAVTQASAAGIAESNSVATGSLLTHTDQTGSGVQMPVAAGQPLRVSNNASASNAAGRSDTNTKSTVVSQQASQAETSGAARTEQFGEAIGHASGSGGGRTVSGGGATGAGGSETQTRGESRTDSYGEMLGTSLSLSRSRTESKNVSLTLACSPLALPPKVVEEDSGRLTMATQDQFSRWAAKIGNLPKQHCVVSVRDYNAVFTVRVSDVYDPYVMAGCSPATRQACIDSFVDEMMGWHGCFYRPAKKAIDAAPVRTEMLARDGEDVFRN